jgi:sugar lactone lactonase YvrE
MTKTLRHLTLGPITAFTFAASLLAHPGSGIAVDRQGIIYFADTGGGVWKIDADRKLTRVHDARFHWLAMDLGGRFGVGRVPSNAYGDFVRTNANPTIISSSDVPVTIAGDGAVYFPERGRSDGRLQIIRWTSAGERSVFALLPARTETGPLEWINGLAAAPGGGLFYTEDKAIRKIDAGGTITTVAANVVVKDCVSIPGNEPAEGALLRGLAVDSGGIVYVAASGCGAVLKVGLAGDVTPIHRTAAPWSPTAVALHGQDVYVLEYLHTAAEDRQAWIPRVRQLRADGSSVLLATVTR